jgi:hypothetical protein
MVTAGLSQSRGKLLLGVKMAGLGAALDSNVLTRAHLRAVMVGPDDQIFLKSRFVDNCPLRGRLRRKACAISGRIGTLGDNCGAGEAHRDRLG